MVTVGVKKEEVEATSGEADQRYRCRRAKKERLINYERVK